MIEIPPGFGRDRAPEEPVIDPAPLLAVCERIVAWLDRLAERCDEQARTTTFGTLRGACEADARNYRATAASVRAAVATAKGGA